MFKQIFIDNWHSIAAIGIFAFTFIAYLFLVFHAAKLKDEESKHLSGLPLDDGKQPSKKRSVNSSGPELRPHVYDGIQEYDNKLPNWWLYTLYIAIVFYIGWWVAYYQFGIIPSDGEELHKQIIAVQQAKDDQIKELASKISDEKLWEMSKDSSIVQKGSEIYQLNCSPCHAADLSAKMGAVSLPGQPLNNDEWKYGGEPMQILQIVQKGSPDKTAPVQMPPWEQVLSAEQITQVVAFVLSHHTQPE
ncbi:MAG: cbb3-type cytochrome c oxidase N-terminal domain-containing protein [Chthoniobacterales bacterium]